MTEKSRPGPRTPLYSVSLRFSREAVASSRSASSSLLVRSFNPPLQKLMSSPGLKVRIARTQRSAFSEAAGAAPMLVAARSRDDRPLPRPLLLSSAMSLPGEAGMSSSLTADVDACVSAPSALPAFSHHDALVSSGESEFDATFWQVAFEIASCMGLEAGDLTLCFVGEVFLDDSELAEILDSGCDIPLHHHALSDDDTDGISIKAVTPVVWIHLVRRDGGSNSRLSSKISERMSSSAERSSMIASAAAAEPHRAVAPAEGSE